MKPKATTIQERMGFRDPELSTPEHDAIILWLIKNKAWTAHYLMPKTGFIDDSRLEKLLPAGWKNFFDPTPSARTEVPVKSGSFVVGFVDLVISKGRWCIQDDRTNKYEDPSLAKFASANETSYPDSVAIEVKPKITSFGETMRQIRHYQSYWTETKFAICTPDLRFKEAFIEQGVGCFWLDEVKSFARQEIAARQMLLAGEVTDAAR